MRFMLVIGLVNSSFCLLIIIYQLLLMADYIIQSARHAHRYSTRPLKD
uniref:Uncharacterized protein n=1 Tax=Arundo donax TaxID=35708 RepID=A0A0A9GSS2_ARUDO